MHFIVVPLHFFTNIVHIFLPLTFCDNFLSFVNIFDENFVTKILITKGGCYAIGLLPFFLPPGLLPFFFTPRARLSYPFFLPFSRGKDIQFSILIIVFSFSSSTTPEK